MLATVRNRRGLVTSVTPYGGGPEGQVHLVTVEYFDGDGAAEDSLIWEREVGAKVLEPTALPLVHRDPPMRHDEFDAMVRAARWSALTPYNDPDREEGPLTRLPISSPLHAAIQIEDYQLVPLLKALRMPRVLLLLADDVGLGKTIEAGLILQELLLRRRVRRVMIACPAALRVQWQEEMHEKFSLSFDIVDRGSTHELQRHLGFEANPWRTFSHVITSYHYLKQADVLERFRSASRRNPESPHLPWDLLIVDEAHNLSPASLGQDSDLASMLKQVAPLFEHRLFLTATPHSGHTRSFTGLLEMLDPVRFTRKSTPLTDAEKQRVEHVVVRRLKREINEASERPRFAERLPPVAVELRLGKDEKALAEAFQAFRAKVRSLIAGRGRSEELAGNFAIEILGKRLLSCPVAFADSWHRYLEGTKAEEEASAAEVSAAGRVARDESADDKEAETRTAQASHVVGAWLKPLMGELATESAWITQTLARLGLAEAHVPPERRRPSEDSRLDALVSVIEDRVLVNGVFSDDERIVIFTEYKTTLDYVASRLQQRYAETGRIGLLFGQMGAGHRTNFDRVKVAFNDPKDPIRILVATDAASEGLNLQETARYVFHYDIPWNPARLEQRNGRLDRHGQARDVTVFHFTSDDDADLKFMAYVVGKIHTIREDLGSTGEIFDRGIERRLIQGEDDAGVRADIEEGLAKAKGRAQFDPDKAVDIGDDERRKLDALNREVDLDPDTLRDTLDVAMAVEGGGRPRIQEEHDRRYRFVLPIPPSWTDLVDDTLRRGGGQRGALPKLVFDGNAFVRESNGRPIFRPDPDAVLLHLGHPVIHHAINAFARKRFPGADDPEAKATRWTVRVGGVPEHKDALILVTIEELAVNELRETFHHWIRTIRFPVFNTHLEDPLPHATARSIRLPVGEPPSESQREKARAVWEDVESDVQANLDQQAAALSEELNSMLEDEREAAETEENSRFKSRHGELSKMIETSTVKSLEAELAEAKSDAAQHHLFDDEKRLAELLRTIAELEEEVNRRNAHYEELRSQLGMERDRVIKYIIPKRFALRGEARVFPVAIEIRLPGE